MSLLNWFPQRTRRNYWDVWDWPQTLLNQNLGLDFDDDLFLIPFGDQRSGQTNGPSKVMSDENKFAVKLDCSHFKPEEIEVKTIDNNIVIHGKHEEKMDKHGFISREFTRRYTLPNECQPQEVKSSLNSKGVLTIEAPEKAFGSHQRQ